MAALIALVLAAAISPDDCVRKEPPRVHRSKPVKRVYRPKRIFRADPKPIVEDCGEGELPPAPNVVLEEVPLEFSEIAVLTFDVPVPDVPPVAEGQPCECFAVGGVWVGEGQQFAGVPVYVRAVPGVPVPVPAVPEPSTWALVGMSLLAGRLWFRRITRRSDDQTKGNSNV